MTDQEMIGYDGKKESSAIWHHTTVVLRSDIYREAVVRGIDISDACNQALASLTDMEYHQCSGRTPVPPPVIVARNGSLPQMSGDVKKAVPPKLAPGNQCGRSCSTGHRRRGQDPAQIKPRGEPVGPVPAPASPEEQSPEVPARKATVPKGHAVPGKKRSKGDALKTFFSSKIVRTEEAGSSRQ